ncbi:hypothetical protein BASA81_007962 [Batrachochytrium salamandrivorans]|nr:hypothetical protein BASA81_007962 [Batrachochytrium salamandrivorans]
MKSLLLVSRRAPRRLVVGHLPVLTVVAAPVAPFVQPPFHRQLSNIHNAQKPGFGVSPDNAAPKGEFLKLYGQDLTEQAKQNKIDPVIGREKEVLRVLQILSRRTKNNAVLIGQGGVGKTAIAGEIAARIYSGEVPSSLLKKRVVSLDLTAIVAGAKYKGEFEERLQGVLKDVEEAKGEVILFIDELHLLVGGDQNTMSAANIMKPALARGDLRCIGATTLDEYRKYIENDAALTRRFQSVLVEEPNVEDTISILRGLKSRYEVHHGVRIQDLALVTAARLADRYLTERKMPDKAIDLMDEAASRLRLQQESKPEPVWNLERDIVKKKIELEALKRDTDELSVKRKTELELKLAEMETQFKEMSAVWEEEKAELGQSKLRKKQLEDYKHELELAERQGNYLRAGELKHSLIPKLEREIAEAKTGKTMLQEFVTSEHIAQVVASQTGIPQARLEQGERDRLLKLDDELMKRVVGQNSSVHAVSNMVRQSRAGLRSKNRPLGVFLFLGPTGTGKTELCKALAEYLFDDESHIVRIDMSEYGEKHSVSRLIGAPPGYVGFEQGGQLTEAVRRRPYQVILFDEFEKAHKDVGNVLLQVFDEGRLTDSHGRTVDFRNTIIVMTSNLGSQAYDNTSASETEQREDVMRAVRGHFAPELLNRIDDVCIFSRLTRKNMDMIVTKELKYTQDMLHADHEVVMEFDSKLKSWLADVGFDPQYGARPLRRAIQNFVLNPLSTKILDGTIKNGDKVVVGLDDKTGDVDVKVV